MFCKNGHGKDVRLIDKDSNLVTISKNMDKIISSRWLPIVLLTCSNIFMTFAWYGHLKFKEQAVAARHPGELGHRFL